MIVGMPLIDTMEMWFIGMYVDYSEWLDRVKRGLS
jgi:hypothetical protein